MKRRAQQEVSRKNEKEGRGGLGGGGEGGLIRGSERHA